MYSSNQSKKNNLITFQTIWFILCSMYTMNVHRIKWFTEAFVIKCIIYVFNINVFYLVLYLLMLKPMQLFIYLSDI